MININEGIEYAFQVDKYLGGRIKSSSNRNFIIISVVGIITFIILPSALFSHVESGWTYLDSVYYSFVSLATIGFGDLTHNAELEETYGQWIWAYRLFSLLWLILGLGYISMIHDLFKKLCLKKSGPLAFGRTQETMSSDLTVMKEEAEKNPRTLIRRRTDPCICIPTDEGMILEREDNGPK